MIDEKALRREGFRDGPRIKLADGQEWTFPAPRFRVTPVEAPDGTIATRWGATHGADFDRTLEIFWGCADHTLGELFTLRFRLAAELLRRNYTLTGEDLAALLAFVEEDPASDAMWADIDAVLAGATPEGKGPSPDGPDGP